VVDSYPGSGKTTWAINYMNAHHQENKFLYITPFLDETDRITQACPRLNFERPSAQKGKGRKMTHLLELLQEGCNISSTHALFAHITDEVIEALRISDYVLILDEVFQVMENFDMWDDQYQYRTEEFKADLTRVNIDTLVTKEFISINDDYSVSWIDEENPLHKYDMLKKLADRGLLYIIRGSLLLWSFPTEVFKKEIFDEVFVLTYQFENQLQHYYYKYFGINYEKYYISNKNGYNIEKFGDGDHDLIFREMIKDKIIIVESDKLNKVGDPYLDSGKSRRNSTMSKRWYNRHLETVMPFLQNNMSNFFANISGSKAGDRMWTSFAIHKMDFVAKNINSKHWVALNSRATNKYGNKTALAYMINRYMNPFYDAFFSFRKVELDQDGFALSELVQWIFRSAIRNNEQIILYIPSWRMRSLLKAYLENRPLNSIYTQGDQFTRRAENGMDT